MTYLNDLKKRISRIKIIKEFANDNGWKSGKEIRDILDKRQSWEYIRLCGYIEGMRKSRRLTLAVV